MLVKKEKTIRSAEHASLRENLDEATGPIPAFEKYGCKSLLVSAYGTASRLLLFTVVILTIVPNKSWAASKTNSFYETFQVGLPSADIVILFDASLSMKNHQYGDVRQAVIDFVPALSDKENLHLRLFGNVVSNPLEGKGSGIAESIEGYLPKEPLFSHTDLGLAILKGLDFLEREGASEVQAFFLLTDGLHQPPDGSPYSRNFANDPNWQALQRRAQALCRQRRIFVYGFGLVQQTDIAVLRHLFHAQNVEVIVGNASQVAHALQQVRERLRQTQLRRAIEQELTEGKIEARLARTSIDGNITSFELLLTIHNAYRYLSINIEQVEVLRTSSASNEIECTLEDFPANAVLEPGKQLQVTVKGKLRAEPLGLRIGEIWQSYAATFEFVPVAHFQQQSSLAEFGASSSLRNINSASLSVNLGKSYGIPYWVLGGAMLMITGMAGIAVSKVKRAKRRLEKMKQQQSERRRLAGTLKIWRIQQVEPEGRGVDLSIYHEEKLEIVVVEGDRLEVLASGFQPSEVVARLSGGLVRALSDDATLEKPEFYVEPAIDHKLAYESNGEMCEAVTLILCANDFLEIDDTWRLRYVNEKLRTRAEFESAQAGGI